MNALLLDTDVFSFFLKKDTRAELYRRHVEGKCLALSFMSVAELYRWTVERSWSQKRIDLLQAAMQKCLIVPYDNEMAWLWARVMSTKGCPISAADAWIAASALRHKIPLVTNNGSHFSQVPNLKVICETNDRDKLKENN